MKLSKGFKDLASGKARTLTITKAVYDEKYDKMRIHFRDEDGGTGMEQMLFVNAKGAPNEVALNIFSTIVKCALRDWTLEEIDDFEQLVGCRVVADVATEDVTFDDGSTRTFTRIRNYREAPDDLDDLDALL